jgi:hypothetical protein
MNTKITFVKEKDMEELDFSSKQIAVVNEGGNTPPLQPSCSKL